MAEVGFVIKSFIVTCVVVFCLQFKMGAKTGDQWLNDFLQKGVLTRFLKDSGEGATRLTASMYNSVKEGNITSPFSKVEATQNVKEEFEKNENLMQQKAAEMVDP